MIRNPKILEIFNSAYLKRTRYSLKERIRIYEEMYIFASSLGVFSKKNPLEGIEDVLRMAKVLNYKRKDVYQSA